MQRAVRDVCAVRNESYPTPPPSAATARRPPIGNFATRVISETQLGLRLREKVRDRHGSCERAEEAVRMHLVAAQRREQRLQLRRRSLHRSELTRELEHRLE